LTYAAGKGSESSVKTISLFVSSPGDVQPERDAVSRVIHRINDEQRGLLNIRDIRWENAYYGAHDTFQSQIIAPSGPSDKAATRSSGSPPLVLAWV
jgi:hypothetical protein